MELNTIYNADCLGDEGLTTLPDNSIDLLITDLPYGVTKAAHDIKIPLEDYIEVSLTFRGREKIVFMTEKDFYDYTYKQGELTFKQAKDLFNTTKKTGLMTQLFRVVKDNGALIFFGQDKFTTEIMQSALKYHRYNLIWNKKRTTGFLNANKMPLRQHEDILVFYKKPPVYNPQKVKGKPNHSRGKSTKPLKNQNYGSMVFIDNQELLGDMKHPTSILSFDKPHPPVFATQKPTALLEWLIKSYSNENDVVLDCCIGSGSTMLGAQNTNRQFIGFEKDTGNFEQSLKRIEENQRLLNSSNKNLQN